MTDHDDAKTSDLDDDIVFPSSIELVVTNRHQFCSSGTSFENQIGRGRAM